MSSAKRKHVTLTLEKKCEILKRLEKGEKIAHLSKEFNIGRATIHDIKQNKNKIEDFFKTTESSSSERKTLRKGEFPQVEDALYAWFVQERNRHSPISGEILKEKARFFYNRILEKEDFRASDGWLDKFKRRFGIRLLTLTGERLSCDLESVEPFIEKFKSKVEELGLGPDQIYNADESGLFWRLLPKKTFVHKAEASAPGRKLAKDRLTFMPCANASGTHKLQLLVIGKSKNPRPFKNVQLPVYYTNQKKAWMNQNIFTNWFQEKFVPEVKFFLNKQNLPQKALLILDNCPGHPDTDELKSKDGKITAMFLPPNVTPLLQPMDQNVIQTVKTSYKKSLLYSVLSKEGSVVAALKSVNIKDVVFNLARAWENLATKTIVCSWGKLWPSLNLLEVYKKNSKTDSTLQTGRDDELNSLQEAISEELVSVCEDLTADDVTNWLDGDDEERYQVMTDDEIIADARADEDEEDGEGGVDPATTATAARSVSHNIAISAFDTAVLWAEENGVSAPDMLTLKRLQEKVVKLSFQSKKQKTMESFFSSKN